MSLCTMVLGFKFIYRFQSKNIFDGAVIEPDNALVIMNQKGSCTSKPKSNLEKYRKLHGVA